jgi:beta-lactamase regulating signal transducer with metallopeptidase domain
MFELNNQNDGTCFYCANGNRIYRYTQDWRPLLNILSVLDSCLYIWCYPPLARTHFTQYILHKIYTQQHSGRESESTDTNKARAL